MGLTLAEKDLLKREFGKAGLDTDFLSNIATKLEGSLTQAQIQAMNSTPIELLAAPAAGYAHVVDEIEIFHDYATAAYTGGGDLSLKYAGSSTIALFDVALVTATADKKVYVKPSYVDLDASTGTAQGFDLGAVAALAIQITNASAAFADGNASNILKYRINYRTVKLLS